MPAACESFAPEPAAVAAPAGAAVRVRLVARHRHRVVDAERRAAADDVRLGELDERRVQTDGLALDGRTRREIREVLEGADECGPAVRVARVVHGVHADVDVARPHDLGKAERESQEDVLRAGT